MKHIDIYIKGKVQRVFFRASSKAVADQLGIRGFAKNLEDGRVYIEAEGDDFSLDLFLEFCRQGPDNAEVEDVEVRESGLKNYKNFEVLRK